jgi:glycosyltransferase involved in cell wall biosynthesis
MDKILLICQKVDEKSDVMSPFLQWILEFNRQVKQVTVITQYEGKHSLPKEIKVLSLGAEKGYSKVRQVARYKKLIVQERKNYDYVWSHMIPHYFVVGAPIFKIFGKKMYLWYTHKSVSQTLRIAHALVDGVFTGSESSFRMKSNKVLVTGQGVNTDLFLPPKKKRNSKTTRMVTASRLSPIKNIHLMIEAVHKLNNEDLVFDIYGSPATKENEKYLQELKALIKKYKLEKKVSLKGPVSNTELPKLYLNYDLFINLSDTGSMDRAIPEAMACDMKILCSNVAVKDQLRKENFVRTEVSEIVKKLNFLIHKEQKSYRDLAIKQHSLKRLVKLMISVMDKGKI